MSATGRNKTVRDELDFYPTPSWCIERFIEKAGRRLNKGVWVEPCAGDGAIIRACSALVAGIEWQAVEYQDRFKEELSNIDEVRTVSIGDFLSWQFTPEDSGKRKADVILTNPPYKIAQKIIQHSMSQAEQVCMLLRINFLSSKTRCEWMKKHTPDVYVLPNRPSFRGKGTDATDYAWFVWDKQSTGKITILDLTDREVRTAEKKVVRKMLADKLGKENS